MKIVVHLHLYYLEMWQDFEALLPNLDGYKYDLFVTLVEDDRDTVNKILKFKSDAKIMFVENRGYDIGPFFYFLRNINLDEYGYVIKLHSKSKLSCTNINSRKITRAYWFKLLVNALIGSKTIFRKNFHELQNNPKIGMIGSNYLITKTTRWCNKPAILKVMNSLGFGRFSDIKFVAGSMFIVRARILKVLQGLSFSIKDFQVTTRTKDGTLAHAMERVLGSIVIVQNYEIHGFDKDIKFELASMLYKIKRFLYQNVKTSHGKRLIKICRIPIWDKKIRDP
jgi:lipopolysaccharide biosynthesis protein